MDHRTPSELEASASAAYPHRAPPESMSDRQLLEETVHKLRRLEAFMDLAERHPWLQAILRRN